MNFPLLKRYSKAQLKENPALRFADQDTIRRAAQKLSQTDYTLVHFSEGTRASFAKMEQVRSPFKNLLPPRAGGLAIFLNDITTPIDAFFDVTIVYPDNDPHLLTFLRGKIKRIDIKIRQIEFPDALKKGRYEDGEYREAFKNWLNQIWIEKDALITKTRESFEQ